MATAPAHRTIPPINEAPSKRWLISAGLGKPCGATVVLLSVLVVLSGLDVGAWVVGAWVVGATVVVTAPAGRYMQHALGSDLLQAQCMDGIYSETCL